MAIFAIILGGYINPLYTSRLHLSPPLVIPYTFSDGDNKCQTNHCQSNHTAIILDYPENRPQFTNIIILSA